MHRLETDAPSPQVHPTIVHTARLRPNCDWALRKHCRKGHPYSPENTYVTKNGYRQCRACNRARDEERKKNKPERRKALNANTRRWQSKNRDKVNAARKRHLEAHPGYMKQYRAVNPRPKCAWTEADRERARRYRKNNPALMLEQEHRVRARRRKASGRFTKEQWLARLAYHGWKCRYCGSTKRLTIDHMIPLCRGGTNWASNLVPACFHCNSTKHLRTFKEFISIQK